MNAEAARATAFVGRAIGWILIATGTAGLGAAFALAVEKVRLLEDPTYTPICSFDEVVSCASVMTSQQSEAFGFPNPLMGIAGFAAVAAFGVAVAAGAALSRWVWMAIQAGLTFALVFAHWLFVQSTYDIGALCPFCAAVWIATIAAFVYVTLHNLASYRLPVPSRARPVVEQVVRYHSVIVVAWLAVLATLVVLAFRDHWRTLV